MDDTFQDLLEGPDKTTTPDSLETTSSELLISALHAKIAEKRTELGIVVPDSPQKNIWQQILDKTPKPTAEEIAERNRQRAVDAEDALHRERFNRWKKLAASLGKRYSECDLETFEVSSDDQRKKVDALKEYSLYLPDRVRDGEGIVLFGPKGTGKDHLLAALMRIAVLDFGLSVHWLNGMDLFGEIRDRMDADKSEADFVRNLAYYDVFAISDPVPPVGTLTEWQANMFFRVIDRRYRDNKPTWITANIASTEEGEKRLSGQILDRLKDKALTIRCNWPSYRKSK